MIFFLLQFTRDSRDNRNTYTADLLRKWRCFSLSTGTKISLVTIVNNNKRLVHDSPNSTVFFADFDLTWTDFINTELDCFRTGFSSSSSQQFRKISPLNFSTNLTFNLHSIFSSAHAQNLANIFVLSIGSKSDGKKTHYNTPPHKYTRASPTSDWNAVFPGALVPNEAIFPSAGNKLSLLHTSDVNNGPR